MSGMCLISQNKSPTNPLNSFTELRRLVKNCECGELTDSILKDGIVEGINSNSTRARLLREKDLALQRCIDVYKAAEVVHEHMKTLTA